MNVPNNINDHEIVIGIGSNHNPEKNIVAALDALEKNYGILKCSPIYQSTANSSHALEKNHIYYNLVVSFSSKQNITDCKKNLRKIEDVLGRKRNHANVSCDLDLLLYGDICKTIGKINIPHRDITQCDYVLRPLADLMPEKEHPQLKIAYKKLWQTFNKTTTLEPVELKWNEKLLSIRPACLSL